VSKSALADIGVIIDAIIEPAASRNSFAFINASQSVLRDPISSCQRVKG
jgi:hypothetical protein